MQVGIPKFQATDPRLDDQKQLFVNDNSICKAHYPFQNSGQRHKVNEMDKMNFTLPWNRSDIVLLVGEQKFHVHRCILAHWSPVFELMFNADFREKYETEIRLHDKKADEIQEMLEVIYDRRKKITDNNYSFLLRLGDEFQMEQLLEECRKFLESADKSGIKALRYIDTTNYINMEDIRADCISRAKDIPSDVLAQCSDYENLDTNSRIEIATARLQMLEDIVRRYEATCNYVLEYLYESAYNEYLSFLRTHGLEESSIAKCENLEQHRSEYLGTAKRFYLHCSTCRHKINSINRFQVSTNELKSSLQKMYELIYHE